MTLPVMTWLRPHLVCPPPNAATALTASLFSASGWVSYSPAPPVHWLARLPGHAPLQALSAQSGPAAGEVAGAVRRTGGTHRGPLPVSTVLGRHLQGHGVVGDRTALKMLATNTSPKHAWLHHISTSLKGQWECIQRISTLQWTWVALN